MTRDDRTRRKKPETPNGSTGRTTGETARPHETTNRDGGQHRPGKRTPRQDKTTRENELRKTARRPTTRHENETRNRNETKNKARDGTERNGTLNGTPDETRSGKR